MSFLPQGYEPPKSEGGNYMKLQSGENRLRILASPVIGYLSWVDNKPMRSRTREECPAPSDPKQKIRHFWAMPVFNYAEKRIQVWEVTQLTIMESLVSLSNNEEWGAPTEYGLTITKSGEKLETSYIVTPSPHRPVSDEIQSMFGQTPVNLDALFSGGDPFDDKAGPAPSTNAAPTQHSETNPPPGEYDGMDFQ